MTYKCNHCGKQALGFMIEERSYKPSEWLEFDGEPFCSQHCLTEFRWPRLPLGSQLEESDDIPF